MRHKGVLTLQKKQVHCSDTGFLGAAQGTNGAVPAAGLESSIVDDAVMALLESVRAGHTPPAAAAMRLRERAAGYQQVCHSSQPSAQCGRHLACKIIQHVQPMAA